MKKILLLIVLCLSFVSMKNVKADEIVGETTDDKSSFTETLENAWNDEFTVSGSIIIVIGALCLISVLSRR